VAHASTPDAPGPSAPLPARLAVVSLLKQAHYAGRGYLVRAARHVLEHLQPDDVPPTNCQLAALNELARATGTAGITLLTAAPGCGKSWLAMRLLEGLCSEVASELVHFWTAPTKRLRDEHIQLALQSMHPTHVLPAGNDWNGVDLTFEHLGKILEKQLPDMLVRMAALKTEIHALSQGQAPWPAYEPLLMEHYGLAFDFLHSDEATRVQDEYRRSIRVVFCTHTLKLKLSAGQATGASWFLQGKSFGVGFYDEADMSTAPVIFGCMTSDVEVLFALDPGQYIPQLHERSRPGSWETLADDEKLYSIGDWLQTAPLRLPLLTTRRFGACPCRMLAQMFPGQYPGLTAHSSAPNTQVFHHNLGVVQWGAVGRRAGSIVNPAVMAYLAQLVQEKLQQYTVLIAVMYAPLRETIKRYLTECGLAPQESGAESGCLGHPNELYVNTARQGRGSTKECNIFLLWRRLPDDEAFVGQMASVPGLTSVSISRGSKELHILSEMCKPAKSKRDYQFGRHLVILQRFLAEDPDVYQVDVQSELARLSQTNFYRQAVDYIAGAAAVIANMAADSDDDENREDCNSFFESVAKLKGSLLSSAGAQADEPRHVRTRYMPAWFMASDVRVDRWSEALALALGIATAICYLKFKKSGTHETVNMPGVAGILHGWGPLATT
jgi:hypothetical protein